MSRIRSIHPGLFTDEAFMSASIPARILIIGLWTEAWDDGVFEWKPLTLKARLFPVDAVNVEEMLGELTTLGFLCSFQTGGKKYGAIRNFRKWQKPKTPNSSGVLPPDLVSFVALPSEPLPNHFGNASEKPSLMEEGGGKREEEEKKKEVEVRVTAPPTPKEAKSKGTRLPDDWQPSPENFAYGHQKGLHQPEIVRAGERFKLWALSASGPNAIKRNWSMAFHNWLLSDAEKLGRSGPVSAPTVEAVPQNMSEAEFEAWWAARRASA